MFGVDRDLAAKDRAGLRSKEVDKMGGESERCWGSLQVQRKIGLHVALVLAKSKFAEGQVPYYGSSFQPVGQDLYTGVT